MEMVAEASIGEAFAVRALGAGDHETVGGDADNDVVTGLEASVDEPDAAQADVGDFAREVVAVDGWVGGRTDADALCGRCG